MNATIEWVLDNLRDAARIVEYNGQHLTVPQLRAVMLRAKSEGYTSIKEVPDSLVDDVLNTLNIHGN